MPSAKIHTKKYFKMQQPTIEISLLDYNGDIVETKTEPIIAMVWGSSHVATVNTASYLLYYNPAAEEFVNVSGTVTGKLLTQPILECKQKND